MRAGELQTVARLADAFSDLRCQGILGLGEKKTGENVFGPAMGGLPI